jgi:hypothetical protein
VSEPLATEAFIALRMLGFGEHDTIGYHVVFEADRLHQATHLAAALRVRAHGGLKVRPASLRMLCVRQWSVVLTLPAMPLRLGSLRSLEGELRELAQRHAGCRLASLHPALDGRQPRQTVERGLAPWATRP